MCITAWTQVLFQSSLVFPYKYNVDFFASLPAFCQRYYLALLAGVLNAANLFTILCNIITDWLITFYTSGK